MHDVVAPAEKLCRYSLQLHHTFVPVVASLGKISKFSVVIMDADGVTRTGASRREYSGALAAPITFVRGLKVSKFFLKNGSDREIAVAKKDHNPMQVVAKYSGSQLQVMEISHGRL